MLLKILFFCVILIAGLFTLSCSFRKGESKKDHAPDAIAIRSHIDEIFQAYINKDVAKVKSTHSANWRGFLSFSDIILRGIDDYMKEATQGDALDKQKTWRIVSYKMLDYDIVFHKQTGIVSYIAELFWQDGGAGGSYKLRSIDIYGKENGSWIQLASNIGPLPQNMNHE